MATRLRTTTIPAAGEALPGPPQPLPVAEKHFVNGNRLAPPFPAGFAGGFTPNPTYPEVCTGQTGHTEVVRVVFDPEKISYSELLKAFRESHDPTQGMRQGGDVGTQYRSAIHAIGDRQLELAGQSKAAYQRALADAGCGGPITTEVGPAPEFFYAEDYHQQYLAKNPDGYCGLGGTGVACPAGLRTSA